MQTDKLDLKEAAHRRLLGKAILFIALSHLIPYSFFLVSDGFRNFMEFGHGWLAVSVFCFVVTFYIMKPIYKLENPFLYSLDQKRNQQG
ncbi:MAG: hypothetical protein ACI9VT_004042 [Psychroserpens sp.]|jgi:hypothetical protein